MVAGVGFEPHDLRVMSPTSYQTALSRDIKLCTGNRCRKPGLNRYVTLVTRDFKSRASANSAIPACWLEEAYAVCVPLIASSLAACIVYHIRLCLSRAFSKKYIIFFIPVQIFGCSQRADRICGKYYGKHTHRLFRHLLFLCTTIFPRIR